MTTTATQEQRPAEANRQVSDDIFMQLDEFAKDCRSKRGFYCRALAAMAEHFGAPYAAIRVALSASTLDERVTSETVDTVLWDPVMEDTLLECQAEGAPIARLYDLQGDAARVALMTVPVCEQSGQPVGALGIMVRCDSSQLAKAYLSELKALVSLMATRARLIASNGSETAESDGPLKRAVVKASDFQSLRELAFAVTNSLKNRFACDQVVFGQVKRHKIQILSISGLDTIHPRSPGVRRIRESMEECLDYGAAICCQNEERWSGQSLVTNHRLHRKWHEDSGGVPVASVPLLVGKKCIGVLSMTRRKQSPFTEEELTEIREAVGPFAPAMMLMDKAERGLLSHAVETVRRAVSWLMTPGTYRRKAAAVAIVASVAYFCFAPIGYEITVPSQIAPTEVRCFAAPFEGTVRDCHVEVGDKVVPGQLLYEMETTELQLEQEKLKSELAVLQLRGNRALAAEDVKEAASAAAEMRVVQAKLAITQHDLSAAHVRAPFHGTVVSGELSKRIGEVVPLGEPLLESVPKGDWSVNLLVPESRAAELAVGGAGRFACNARPEQPLDCRIVRIRPSSEPQKGKNVFVAEAAVEANPGWMRAGMQGVAQIRVGERPVWWVALHRVIDYVRLTFWL